MFNENEIFIIKNNISCRIFSTNEIPSGLKLEIQGKNNKIIIGEKCVFKNAVIQITNNHSFTSIGNGCTLIGLTISINAGEKQCIDIGTSTTFFGGMIVLRDNSKIKIGNDCLFANGLSIWATDGHAIYDLTTNEVINKTPEQLTIGNHCWIGGTVHILKNGSLPDETVVGTCSVVTQTFTEPHTVIGGFPAKILKRNIGWNRHTILNWEKINNKERKTDFSNINNKKNWITKLKKCTAIKSAFCKK